MVFAFCDKVAKRNARPISVIVASAMQCKAVKTRDRARGAKYSVRPIITTQRSICNTIVTVKCRGVNCGGNNSFLVLGCLIELPEAVIGINLIQIYVDCNKVGSALFYLGESQLLQSAEYLYETLQ